MKFTKENSVEMYGIAILLMVFHHLFKSYIGSSTIQTIAYFGKICVAIFAFISGYGLSVISEKFSLKEKTLLVLKQIWKLYRKYWIVFCVFIPISVIFIKNQSITFTDFVLNFSAIKFDYNGAWWYIRNYVFMLLTYPIASCFLGKKFKSLFPILCIVFFSLYYVTTLPIVFLITHSTTILYLLIFWEGIWTYNIDFYKKVDSNGKKMLAICLFLCCAILRVILAKAPGYGVLDLFIVFPLTITISTISSLCGGKISMGLRFFGTYSTFIWLVHCFFIPVRFNALGVLTPIIQYFYVLFVSLVIAFILSKAEGVISNFWLKEKTS